MKFQLDNGALEKTPADCVVIGVYEDPVFSESARKLDKISQGYLTKLQKKGDAPTKIGQTVLLYHVPNIKAERVLLVGCGKEKELNLASYRKIIASSIKALSTLKITNILLCLSELSLAKHTMADKIKQIVQVSREALYQFTEFKREKKAAPSLQEIYLCAEKITPKLFNEAIKQGAAIATGATYTKNLANLPSNVCTPSYLAKEAKTLAKKYSSIKTRVLENSFALKIKGRGKNKILSLSLVKGLPSIREEFLLNLPMR